MAFNNLVEDRVRIVVTDDDIHNGKREETTSCPIAIAMTRAFGEKVCVGETQFDFVDAPVSEVEDYDMRFPLPTEAQRFVLAYDNEVAVAPFEFVVAVPSERPSLTASASGAS